MGTKNQTTTSKQHSIAPNVTTTSLLLHKRSEIAIMTRNNKEALTAFDLCMKSLAHDSERVLISSELAMVAESSGIHGRSAQLIAIILKNTRRKDNKKARDLREDLKIIQSTKQGSDVTTFFYMARKFDPSAISGAESQIEKVFEDMALEKANSVVKRVKEILKLQ